MSHETYMMALEFGVPAIAAIALVAALRKKATRNGDDEAQIACALEGDLTPYIKSLNRGEVM
jgi:predicted HD phosphohydrolase